MTRSAIPHKTILAAVGNMLGIVGFECRGATWNRRYTDYLDVVDIQLSKARDCVTINAGVLRTDLYESVWASLMPDFVEEPSCTVRTRVGSLIDGKDLWWSVADPNAIDDIREKLEMRILPFINGMHSDRAMSNFLVESIGINDRYPPPTIFLALLKAKQGDISNACSLLRTIRQRTLSTGWRDRVETIAKNISCG